MENSKNSKINYIVMFSVYEHIFIQFKFHKEKSLNYSLAKYKKNVTIINDRLNFITIF